MYIIIMQILQTVHVMNMRGFSVIHLLDLGGLRPQRLILLQRSSEKREEHFIFVVVR